MCVCCECREHRREHHRQDHFFSLVKFNSWCQILDNLIGWTLTNAGEVMLNLNLSITQTPTTLCWRQPYCEPTLRVQPRCISTYIHTLVTITTSMYPTRCSYRQQGSKGESPSIIKHHWCRCLGGIVHILVQQEHCSSNTVHLNIKCQAGNACTHSTVYRVMQSEARSKQVLTT